MTFRDPRFAWTLYMRPAGVSGGVLPDWPELVRRHFDSIPLGSVDPIARILRGPLPARALARRELSGGEIVLSGLGNAIALTSVSSEPGEVERDVPTARLRRAAVRSLLGLEDDGGDEDLTEQLLENLRASSGWEVAGLVEVQAVLAEGFPEDLPEGDGWRALGPLRLHRAAGVGEGHGAWTVEGWCARTTQEAVVQQHLRVVCEGHGARVPPFVDYGWCSVRWGAAAQSAAGRSEALAAVVDAVRLATSWAIAGGPYPGDAPPDLPLLAARLEAARVGLQEDIELLRALRGPLHRAAARVLGEGMTAEPGGPLVEASSRADAMVETLVGREAEAARWSGALAAARDLPTA